MASGSLSPRQKMINMMYLVLTAMLALNVSKDILKVLHKLDVGMSATVKTVEEGTKTIYDAIEAQISENERAVPFNERAKVLRTKSNSVESLLVKAREDMIEETGGIDTLRDNRMKGEDNRSVSNNYMLNDKSVGGQGAAKEIKERLTEYRSYLIAEVEANPSPVTEELIGEINQAFDFSDVRTGNKKETWETATFADLPLAGVIPFITDLQSKVRRMEARVAEYFYSQIDASALKFDGVRAVVMPKSTYITQGEIYEADVFLAAYNSGNQPEFTDIIPEEIIDGVGKIRIPAKGIGSKTLTGSMTLPGDDRVYTYDVVYTVAPPSVVISPSKMNVLYRNVINPLEISVPGVAPSNIVVNGPGVRGSNGKYNAEITKIKGKEIKISVSVKEKNGKLRRAGSKIFRIKGLPQAVGSVFKKTQGVMSSSLLSKGKVEAEYQDFPFDLPLTVVSFELKMDGQPPMQVKGDKIPSKAKPLIQKLRPGSSVQIRKIIAKTQKGARISRVGIVSIDVQ